jgi:hypothetical protein
MHLISWNCSRSSETRTLQYVTEKSLVLAEISQFFSLITLYTMQKLRRCAQEPTHCKSF